MDSIEREIQKRWRLMGKFFSLFFLFYYYSRSICMSLDESDSSARRRLEAAIGVFL